MFLTFGTPRPVTLPPVPPTPLTSIPVTTTCRGSFSWRGTSASLLSTTPLPDREPPSPRPLPVWTQCKGGPCLPCFLRLKNELSKLMEATHNKLFLDTLIVVFSFIYGPCKGQGQASGRSCKFFRSISTTPVHPYIGPPSTLIHLDCVCIPRIPTKGLDGRSRDQDCPFPPWIPVQRLPRQYNSVESAFGHGRSRRLRHFCWLRCRLSASFSYLWLNALSPFRWLLFRSLSLDPRGYQIIVWGKDE